MARVEADLDKYLAECVAIEPMCLTEEFVRLPSDLAFWNERYSKVYQHWLECKITTEQTRNKLYSEHRDRLEAIGKGRITLAEVEAQLVQDPAYIDVKTAEAVAESEKVRLYGVMDALRAKKEMLISLGAHIRMEMGHDPMIRKQSLIEKEVADNRNGKF